ncbi:hypothetical protein GCM10022399_09710 [Terrabacter ginsenosidimutans]|uniref:Winged helix DNA-binding domain-containing protein n=1 Tax=Terrabacter ginsenosidimutans TaxID=490575 RepID=A0ABP7CRM7_9MICO
MVVHQLTASQARRIAVHAQLLDQPRPTDLVATVERLTFLQIDPTAAIAPSADLVLWSRLGRTYDPTSLTTAIEHDRTLVETVAYVRSPQDIPAVIAEVREAEPYPFMAEWLAANDSFRRDILATLEADGPLLSRDIPDTSVVPWPSTGWTNNRNVTKMLEALALRGEVAIAGRKGRQRYFDLPDRVYPPGLPTLTLEQALAHRNERRLAALGIARATGTVMPGEGSYVGDAGEPAEVEGVPGTWRVHPAYLDAADDFTGRTACSARSTGSSTTASGLSSSGVSSTSSRCTSPRSSAAGATSRCRSCTTTAWSGSSTPRPTARPARSSSTRSTRTSASPPR